MLNTVIQVVGGGIFGFIVAYFTIRAQSKRKLLDIYTDWMTLVRVSKREGRTLKIIVDKETITGNREDSGVPVEVDNAFGHVVRLRNTGNDVIEDFFINILLASDSQIIECHTNPRQEPGYNIQISTDKAKLNLITIIVPYLNPKNVLDIGIISTNNNKPSSCDVKIQGKGIKVSMRGELKVMITILGLLFLSIVILLLSQNIQYIAPNYFTGFKGVVTVKKDVLEYPKFYRILSALLSGIPLVAALWLFWKKIGKRIQGPWE